MQEIQSNQDLLCNFSAQMHGYTFIVISLDDFEQVDSEDLKDKAEMVAIRTLIYETIK